jgi:hypothetical protein
MTADNAEEDSDMCMTPRMVVLYALKCYLDQGKSRRASARRCLDDTLELLFKIITKHLGDGGLLGVFPTYKE